MDNYTFGGIGPLEIKSIPKIEYGDSDYSHYSLREVNVDGERTGEYHISVRCMPVEKAIEIIKDQVGEGSEVFEIDPDRILNLEHNICLKVKIGSIIDSCILDVFETINKQFERITDEYNQS